MDNDRRILPFFVDFIQNDGFSRFKEEFTSKSKLASETFRGIDYNPTLQVLEAQHPITGELEVRRAFRDELERKLLEERSKAIFEFYKNLKLKDRKKKESFRKKYLSQIEKLQIELLRHREASKYDSVKSCLNKLAEEFLKAASPPGPEVNWRSTSQSPHRSTSLRHSRPHHPSATPARDP